MDTSNPLHENIAVSSKTEETTNTIVNSNLDK